MSQVVVTDDNFKDKRATSRDQERKISREEGFAKWRRNDVTQLDGFQKVFGYLTLPIVALWAMICGLIYVVIKVVKTIFGLLGGKS